MTSALVAGDSLKPLAEDWDSHSLKTHGSKFKMALVEASILLGKGGVLEAPPGIADDHDMRIDGDFDEKDLPTNAFIEIDTETGEKTIKKRRGRPPKRRPEDLPAIQYKTKSKTVKEKKKVMTEKKAEKTAGTKLRKEGKKKKKHVKLLKDSKVKRYRRTLQKILLRPVIKAEEIPIAQDIIRIIFVKRRCSIEQLEKTDVGYVLAKALKRNIWAPFPEMMKSFKSVLSNWKSLP